MGEFLVKRIVERYPDGSTAPSGLDATKCTQCGKPIMGGPDESIPIRYSPSTLRYFKRIGYEPKCLSCLAKSSPMVKKLADPEQLDKMVPEPPPEWSEEE